MPNYLSQSNKLSFLAWNINGLSSKSLGNKLRDPDCLRMINNFDFIILSETWKSVSIDLEGFNIVSTSTLKNRKCGRSSGGLALIFKSNFNDWISVEKESPNFLWFKIAKEYTKTEKDIYVCGTYIPPQNSIYFYPELFEELENDIEKFSVFGSILLMGDFNSRTGKYSDNVCQEGNSIITNDQSEFSLCALQRHSFDNELNNHGKRLLEICRSADLTIMNGRSRGDSLGRPTFHGKLGVSVVDYAICDQDLFHSIANFVVKEPSSLSDHSPIMTWLNITKVNTHLATENTNDTLIRLPKQFIWENDSSQKFKTALQTRDIQRMVHDFLVDSRPDKHINSSLDAVERILFTAAKHCLKIKNVKRRNTRLSSVSSNKKWFDKECRLKRHELRKLANLKHRDPLNITLRENYHTVLKQYVLKQKRKEYYHTKISELEDMIDNSNSRNFWNCLKSMDDSMKETSTPPISEESWLSHFQSLHSNEPLNSHQEAIIDELTRLEDATTQSHALDYLITELEIRTAANKLKNNKSSYSDRIKNEMIKSSLNELMPIYLKLFNAVLTSGTMPQTWCGGLITPIFKSGTKSDPSNYRGICISSCLGKLFCSILNHRLLKHIQSRDILHKSQIGFLANNRTADHVLTLRTLIDKYVNCHKTKVYACFVDFRKAFDSVWHDGLLYKLLQINVRGNFDKVIKSLYSNSTCSIRIENNQTQPFQYTRGVRQGCILSPLLFNLYVNDLAFSFNNILSDPFVLPNGTKLNSLFYADDLIILSRSKLGLQNCLNKLSSYCNSWMLKINPKKTKIMVFQKGTKKCDYNFHVGKGNDRHCKRLYLLRDSHLVSRKFYTLT